MKYLRIIVPPLVKVRRPLILVFNLVLTALSFLVALGLRFDFELHDKLSLEFIGLPLLLLLLFRTGAYALFKLNQGYWRYVSTDEAVDLAKAHVLSSVVFAAAIGLLQISGFPRSLVFLELALSLLFCTGSRLLVRLWCERSLPGIVGSELEKEVVVVGGGFSGHLLIKTLHSQPRLPYRPVAVFDDDENIWGSTIHGVKVAGPLSDLADYLEHKTRVGAVIIAIPSLAPTKLQWIESVCHKLDVPLKRLQSFEEIACLDFAEPRASFSIEEVLRKEVVIEHEEEICQTLSGKSVLITGAGGSIGSELVRQVISFGPKKVILLDKSEFNLYSIEQELLPDTSSVEKLFYLTDIVHEERLIRIFREHRPQFVFHAAAYKHVPLLETNCYEAFVNNVTGTRSLLETAAAFGTERFVLISSDKAVDPSSVMGCTKRLAEFMVSHAHTLEKLVDYETRTRPKTEMHVAAVRFGNVINSTGSVIPLFKKQILAGGPITVTHPDMERYFMSIREAVQLVLTAGALGSVPGEIYLLDMGKPVKILKVAEKLRALSGRRDIPIVFSGTRPGEKLTEKLVSPGEEKRKTRFRKIFAVQSPTCLEMNVFAWISAVQEQLGELSDSQIGTLLRHFVSEVSLADESAMLTETNGNGKHEEPSSWPSQASRGSAGGYPSGEDNNREWAKAFNRVFYKVVE